MSHNYQATGVRPRGVDTYLRTSTPYSSSSYSTISEDSLQVPPHLYIRDVIINLKEVKGAGSYGSVYVGSWHHSKVAAKKLHEIFFEQLVTSESKTGILRSFAHETNMLIQLKHPNIVQFYGLYSTRPGYELNRDTYLIQELMHCALSERIRQTPQLTLRNIINLALDVAGGLRYLHERQEPIIHRDLASKNILLSSLGVAKIADLGVAKILDETRQTPQSRLPGTELYMPPEVKIEGIPYDTKVDIYSFGVVLLEMAIGRDAKANEAFRVSPNNSIVLTPEVERRKEDFDVLGHHPLRSIILSCLARREERPTAKSASEQLVQLCSTKPYHNCPVVPVILPVSSYMTAELSNVRLLEEKVKCLQSEKELLQTKLKAQRHYSAEHHLDALMTENATLQAQIAQMTLHQTQRKDNGQLQGFDTNYFVREKFQEGPTSLPEPLPTLPGNDSLMSKVGSNAEQFPSTTLKELSREASDSTEVKKLKKQLDKYKSVNIEMDRKLKEARLELQKYGGRSDLTYRIELDQLRAENRQLENQLHIAMNENGYLQSQLISVTSTQNR